MNTIWLQPVDDHKEQRCRFMVYLALSRIKPRVAIVAAMAGRSGCLGARLRFASRDRF